LHRYRRGVSGTVLALVLLSALLHAGWSASIKGSLNPLAFNATQTAISVPLCLLGLLGFELGDLSGRVLAFLAATSVAHGLYFYWLSRALEHADLTLAYPIVRSTPALLPLLGIPLLGETPSPLGALGIAIVVGGIWGVQGGGLSWRSLAAPELRFAWLTLLATVGYSLADKAAMTELAGSAWRGPLPPALAWFCLISLGCTPLFLALTLRRVSRAELAASLRRDSGRAAAAFAVSCAGYGLILEAFRSAPASYVVAARQTSVLFAAWIGVAFLGERPNRRRLLGAAASVVGVALISWGG